MNFRKTPKPPMEWTDQTDLALRILHENGFTWSGIAWQLGCTRLDVIARAVDLGVYISARPSSKLRALVCQAQKRRAA